jgi:hypothetical protein
MRLPTFSSALLALALLPALAGAAPPVLTTLSPHGAQRGSSIVVTLTGSGLTPHTRLSLPFKAVQKPLPDAKPNPTQVRVQLTVDVAVVPGIYPVRAVNEEGLSSLSWFRVDTLPAIAEIEDNNTPEKAQKVPFPIVVEGQCPGGDVDHFRFAVRKGQHVVVEVESARLGSGVLPQLRITDDRLQLVAADDTQSLAGDARVLFSAPADGELIVELSDSRYRGAAPAHYRLRIADYDVHEEVFPLGGRRGEMVSFTLRGGTLGRTVEVKRKVEDDPAFAGRMSLVCEGIRPGMLPPRLAVGEWPEKIVLHKANEAAAVEVAPPLVVNGRLGRTGQVDRYRFSASPGSRWRLAVAAEVLGSRLDGVLEILDDKGRRVALVDDVDLPAPVPGQPGVRTVDPSADVTVPADSKALVVVLRDQRRRGGLNFGYRLTIEPAVADFTVGLPAAEVNVPRDGVVALSVAVVRRGYSGPIKLVMPNLPAGFAVEGGNVPAEGTTGVLTLRADATAGGEPVSLVLEGQANVAGKELRRPAVMRLLPGREATVASMVMLRRLEAARTSAVPFQLTAAPVTLIKGYPTDVPVRLTRLAGQEKLAVTLTALLSAPPTGQAGITVAPVGPVPVGASAEVKLKLTAGVAAPEGALDLAVVGRAQVGPSAISTSTPAVPVTVRRPFEAALSVTKVELRPGQQVKLVGKLVRQRVCKEPVRLTVSGLPPGVTLANPLKPVAASESQFTVELKAAPKAAAGTATATATLTLAATINGAVYTHPPLTVMVTVGR